MNRIEDDELIAEFMGGVPYHNNTPELIYNNGMLYHNNWEWLMPVVEKIETTYHAVIITQNTCIIKACIMGENTIRTKQVSNYDEVNTKLSNTYKAVVEFIKWFNNK